MSGGGKIDPKTYLQISKTVGAEETLAKPFDLKKL
jgi:hypothetical protein